MASPFLYFMGFARLNGYAVNIFLGSKAQRLTDLKPFLTFCLLFFLPFCPQFRFNACGVSMASPFQVQKLKDSNFEQTPSLFLLFLVLNYLEKIFLEIFGWRWRRRHNKHSVWVDEVICRERLYLRVGQNLVVCFGKQERPT